jgi:hypothetical protein
MAVNTTNLLSGRAQLVPYANLTADRYQFLGLNQAEPSLGAGTTGNVLTLGVSNSRVWTNVLSVASVSATGNITGNYILGNGACLTGVVTSVANIKNGTSNVDIATANGNITMSVNGSSNIVVIGNIAQFTGNIGIEIPYGNTATRPNPADIGTLRLNTQLDQLEIWDGTQWLAGGSTPSTPTIVDQQTAGDGSTVAFILTEIASQSSILVSINGVGQLPGTAYTVTGNTLTFTQAPASTDIIDIRYLSAALSHSQIYNASGNAYIEVQDAGNIVFTTNSTTVATLTQAGVLDISTGTALKLPTYTVAQAANIASPAAGEVIYVSNGDTGNPCLAVYSGGTWKRVSLGATIST